MQFTPLDKKARAEWRGMLIPADGARIAAAAVMFLLSALALPLCATEAMAGLYLLYAVVFYYMLTHSFAAVLAVAMPGVALFGISAMAPALPHPFLMPAVYTALVLGGVGGGFLVIHCRERKYLALLALPLAAYAAVAYLVSPLHGLLVLIPVALSLVYGLGLLNCRPQTPVLLGAAAVLAVSGIGAFLVWYAMRGWPVANPFTYLGALVRGAMGSVYRAALEVYRAQGLELALSDTDIANIAAVIGNILPGLFLAGCGVLAFITYRIHLRVLVAWGTLTKVPVRVGAMTVSPLAAALFILSYPASILAGGSVFGTVCENLSLVLQPALVLVGFTSLLRRDPQKRSGISTFLLIGLAVLVLNYPTLALALAAFVGAVRILLAAFAVARSGKNGSK